ncbi:hypothetical protein NBRGN_065_00770 [Nocardia brasiliensis NBRC 14402]|nr:hypothetical protein CEQ30_30025 [Nocardia brasiliensis]GAJ83681.1 hypothetical protein NBRGN_065_00770 [Nocardia brasiliensis NBRC 14402]
MVSNIFRAADRHCLWIAVVQLGTSMTVGCVADGREMLALSKSDAVAMSSSAMAPAVVGRVRADEIAITESETARNFQPRQHAEPGPRTAATDARAVGATLSDCRR